MGIIVIFFYLFIGNDLVYSPFSICFQMEKIFPYLFKISCDYTSLPLFSKNALVQEYVGDALMYRNIVKLFILSCFLSLIVFLILLS